MKQLLSYKEQLFLEYLLDNNTSLPEDLKNEFWITKTYILQALFKDFTDAPELFNV